MTDIDRLANALFGGKRAESQEVLTDATTRTYIGTATTDSEDGSVYVSLDGDVTLPDDIVDPDGNVIEAYEDNGIEVSVGPSVTEGDEVIVTLVGGGPLKTPMVTAVAGEGDRQDAAIADAAEAAQRAWDYAEEAHTAATTAQQKAEEAAQSAADAAESAETAATAATSAQADASTAAQAATAAQGSASTAATAATNAQQSASSAATAASNAEASASAAASDASSARASAAAANTAANSALTQLSVVEDVAGTLQWISDHGTFVPTTDTTVQEGTVYFELSGGDYVPIAEPSGNPSEHGWYVLDVSESQTDYIMSHLAVTSAGLWVLPSGIGDASGPQTAPGYKLLLAADGSRLYDADGQLVMDNGENIVMSSSRPQYIGGENAFIIYYDSDDDGVPDTIRIGGHVLMGGDKTLSEVLAELGQASTVGNPNLIPAPDYIATTTDVGDGWLHVDYSNTGSSVINHYWNLRHCDAVEPGMTYTIMVEFRNWTCTAEPTGNYMYLQQIAGNQFWGANGVRSDGKEETRQQYAAYIHYEDVADGSMCAHIVKVADVDHNPTDAGNLLRYRMYEPANSSMSFDIRWSLYEGDYSGPYKPYVDQSLPSRVTSAEAQLDVQAGQIALKVNATDVYTKGDTDGLISTEVTNRNNAITAAVEGVELRASQTYSTKTDTTQMVCPNLTPFFSKAPIRSDEGYWSGTSAYWTPTTDGWARFSRAPVTATTNVNVAIMPQEWLRAGETYTLLLEWRNVELTGSATMYAVESAAYQTGTFTDIYRITGSEGSAYRTFVCARDHDAEGVTRGIYWRTHLIDECSLTGEFRISVYEGDYSGPYKPYVDQSLTSRMTSAEASIKVNAEGITSKVSKTDYTGETVATLINQSADSVKIKASHVEIDGTAIFSAISEDVDDAITGKGYATTTQAQGYASTAEGNAKTYVDDKGYQTATDVSTAIESGTSNLAAKADAVARTQRIWYRKTSSGAPAKLETWLSASGTGYDSWSLNVPKLTSDSTKYPYLYTAVQTQTISQQAAGTTCSCSNVLLDDSTTVIDGGNIITGSITSNQIATGAITIGMVTDLEDELNGKQPTGDYATTAQVDELVSVRLTMTRDAWTDAQWATYEDIGHQADWTNGHFDKDGVQTSTGLSSNSLRVGDLIVVSGVSKDTGNTHSVVIRVRVAPASSTAKISAETVSFSNSLQMAGYMQVGGENLLRKTASVTETDLACTRSTVPEAGIILLTPKTSASYAKFIVDYLDFAEYGEGSYTVSFDARLANVTTSYTNMNVGIYLGYSTASRTGVVFSSTYDNYCPMKVLATSLTDEWARYSCTVDVPSDLTSGKAAARVAGSQLSVELAVGGSRKPVEVRRVKLERGTKATDWTPAQDDIDGAITDAAKTATNYVTAIDGKGIWVTPSNAKPDASGDEVAGTTSGWHLAAALELFHLGVSAFKVWVEDAVTKVRVGAAGMAHILMSQSHIEITDGTESVFKVGSITDADGYAEVTERFVADGSAMQLHYVGNHIKGLDQSTTTPTIDPFEVVNLDTATTIDPSDYHFTTVAMASGTRVTLHWDGYTESDKDSVLAVTYYAKPGYGMQVGAESRAAGIASSALGNATAMGDYSHAEGMNSIATGYASHSEGGGKSGDFVIDGGIAVGNGSHAEGVGTIASGNASHAEGAYTKAVGNLSHAGGHGTIAASDAQTVIGRYNVEDASDEYAFIVGNGTSDSNRSNAMAVTWDGEIVGMPGETLFSDDSAPTSNLTGLPDLTEYSRLLIEYRDSGGRGGSVLVDRPSGGTLVDRYFNCMTAGGNSVAGLIIRAKTYFIEDSTTISASHDSYNRYDYSKVTVSPSGGVTYANANEIGIVKVIGFH